MSKNKAWPAQLKRLRKTLQSTATASNSPPAPKKLVSSDRSHSITGTKNTLSACDILLFRQATRTVQPLPQKQRNTVHLHPTGPTRQATSDAHQAMLRRQSASDFGQAADLPLVSDVYTPPDASHDNSRHLQHGYGPDILRDLKKRRWPVRASLDLHGTTIEQARHQLHTFLISCLEQDIRCVHIVHGKGFGSHNQQPVLKHLVRRWLAQWQSVIAYLECTESEGGSGAVVALLKKNSYGKGQ